MEKKMLPVSDIGKEICQLVNEDLKWSNKDLGTPRIAYTILNSWMDVLGQERLSLAAKIRSVIEPENHPIPEDEFITMEHRAVELIKGSIHALILIKRYEYSQQNNWPGEKENCNGK